MKTEIVLSTILLLLSWITLSECTCEDDSRDPDTGEQLMCAADGNFEADQCNFDTGRCWCVDRITGREIPNLLEGTDCNSVQPVAAPANAEASEPTEAPKPAISAEDDLFDVLLAAPPPKESSTEKSEEPRLNFDENDLCYKQNKETYDYWNQKMKNYEDQVQKWQKTMDEYEDYVKSLEEDKKSSESDSSV